MIAAVVYVPKAPLLEMVKVPPLMSFKLRRRFRAPDARLFTACASASSRRPSACRTTGTINPSWLRSPATPKLMSVWTLNPSSSTEALR